MQADPLRLLTVQRMCNFVSCTFPALLQTRTSILGTCNPRGNKRYNPRQPLAAQLNISAPLLSRFDIVLLLLDGELPVEKVARLHPSL